MFAVIYVVEHALVLNLIGKGLATVIGLNEIIVHGAGTGAILISARAAERLVRKEYRQ